ncbi:MAG: SDR family NAD(P)-dependent oxidoreductase [Chlamydiae bacterium]|nr:SDR family NAD(P)-dependent oxidoreductase [Chlamydiota bacterium]
MQRSIKEATALITGASSGIGKEISLQLAELGVNLVITARRLDRLQTLSEELAAKYGIKVIPIQLDVQKNKEVEALFAKLEKEKIDVDILINNAGLALTTDKMQNATVAHWDTMIDTNVKGLLYMTRACLPGMIQRNQGHIVNIGSIAGRSCYPGGNIYCATKHAVKALSKSLRIDLLGTAIRVSEIAPGAVETEFSIVRFQDEDRAKKLYQGFTPLSAEDIADAVVYCLTRPLHVNVEEIVIYPQSQATATDIYRKT